MEFINVRKQEFWNTSPTNCFRSDFKAGQNFGRQFIHAVQHKKCTPFLLSEIVAAWPNELGDIEKGFLAEVGMKLAA
ncbi:hypothetical protein [Neptuniibacter sp. UBA847]|uniref:hypothetical protein n=1 Tax=Neptuniibacter sp. UBA847 TaxID=1946977 RepID=UPI000C3601B1|nr:hypothetical protein [Neptuniibacter sp. UBA847]MAY42263.1 hypothetical protein [Oceanospirillaceae bacterium]|tara:strand:- start:270 stop:500 length:231 start_codon:yes stop_codon:yes gene_type:complete